MFRLPNTPPSYLYAHSLTSLKILHHLKYAHTLRTTPENKSRALFENIRSHPPVQCRIPVLKSLKPNCASREFRAQVIGPLKKCVE